MKTINAQELKKMLSDKRHPTLVNTLPAEYFAETRIADAINIPQDEEDFVQRVEAATGGRDRPVILYCASEECHSAAEAARQLEAARFKHVYHFAAGAHGWEEAGEKLQTTAR